jgi:hypothetical protein
MCGRRSKTRSRRPSSLDDPRVPAIRRYADRLFGPEENEVA